MRKVFIALFFMFFLASCALNNSENKRGSYKGSYYIVKKGDTVYFISVIADKNVNDIISYNNLKPPYVIRPGQKINLWQPKYAYSSSVVASSTSQTAQKSSTSTTSENKKKPTKGVVNSEENKYVVSESKQDVTDDVAKSTSSDTKISSWIWPTKGRVINKFSVGDQGNKGIDIAGQRGQDVVSTAAGVVVYAGDALRGYGNLIIIKHNEEYLSAYAHNDKLLIREGQSVKAGQKIAAMGSTGTNSVRLHFEIRYKGTSVNPEHYLK